MDVKLYLVDETELYCKVKIGSNALDGVKVPKRTRSVNARRRFILPTTNASPMPRDSDSQFEIGGASMLCVETSLSGRPAAPGWA